MRILIKLFLLAIIMLLFGAISYGQNAIPILGTGTNLQISYNKGGGADDSMTAIPVRRGYIRAGDTLYKNYRMKGRIRIDYDSSRFYYHNGTVDVRVLDTKDTVSLIATKSDITVSHTDTTSLSNRIDARVKYTDTAGMLVPYLRKGDTTSMLLPYLRKGDTATMLIPYLRKGDSATGYVTPKRLNDTATAIRSTIAGLSAVYVPLTRTITINSIVRSLSSNVVFTLTTDSITEGVNNLYFTNVRARTAISNGTGIGYNSSTGVITNTGVLSVDGSTGAVGLTTTYHKQGGNSYAATSVIGTTDAFGLSLRTNSVEHIGITSAGAITFTGTTFDFAPTTGAVSISSSGTLTITRASAAENALNIGVTGNTPRLIMGIGAGAITTTGRPMINFSQTGSADVNAATITSSGGNLIFNNIGGNNSVTFEGVSTPMFMVNNINSQPFRFIHRSLFAGGGVTTALDFMTIYYSNNSNANITYPSGTTAARMAIAAPRINTSGSHTGDIDGFVYEPIETAVAAGTVQKAFTNSNQTSGYGVFIANSAVKNHFAGHVLIGTTTDDTKAMLNVVSTTQYVLLPRMTTTQRDAITSPAEGAEIYNTTTHKKEVYDGTVWQACW